MRITNKSERGKYYLQQLNSTSYLSFESKEEMDKYKKWLGEDISVNNVDCELIDTNDINIMDKHSDILAD
jgi:hypothetical protein